MNRQILSLRDSRDFSKSNGAFPNFAPGITGFLLFVIALVTRIAFLFVTPNNGVDAWARYVYAVGWLQNPASLPAATANGAWLPMHFWLLGSVICLWHSEWSARLLTALLGALTVFPFWAAIRRIFGFEVGVFASLGFAFFGFHIGYSVTTSSEVPTIFFLACGLYLWLRFHLERTWAWALASGLFISAACLCRFEAWLISPMLSILLLDYSHPWTSLRSNSRKLWDAVGFAQLSSAGVIGWLLFSWSRWGDPMMLPHRTMSENAGKIAELHHALLYRLAVVPGALLVSLGIVIITLTVPGIIEALRQRTVPATSIVLLSVFLFAFNYYNSIRYEVTQAKYTLVYSWLFFPLAFVGLELVTTHWRGNAKRWAPWSVIFISIVWQIGVVLGSTFAPLTVADKLAVMSPTLPLRLELRQLLAWLKAQDASSHGVVLDEYNYEGTDILRFSGIDPSAAFLPKTASYHDPELRIKVEDFIQKRRPLLLICSPDGPVGRALIVGHQEELDLPSLHLRFHREWAGPHWAVYVIQASP